MDYDKLNEALTKGKKEKFFVSVVPISPMGEVLLGKRTEDGVWTTPGGGAEPGEEPHQAARRELFEEAGLAAGPNELELVNVGETPRGFKIYSFLWRMPMGLDQIATAKLDPDKEVKSWKLYRPEDFPGGMAAEANATRVKTIREALMSYYGISKSMRDDTPEMHAKRLKVIAAWMMDPECQMETVEDLTEERMQSLIDKLGKAGQFEESKHPRANDGKFGHGAGSGGSGGGGEDHKHQALIDLGFEAQDGGSDFDEKKYAHVPKELHPLIEKIKSAADKFHETDEDSPGYGAAEKKLGDATKAYQDAAKKMIGKQAKETPSASHAPVSSDPAKPVNKLQAHLTALEEGGVVPGVKTKSDKPIVTNMEQAKALGYTTQDHVDAVNAHHELAVKTSAMLDKLRMAGRTPPKEGVAIVKFHQKKMKEHMSSRDYLEQRQKHTAAAIKQKPSVNKSTTQMDGGLGDRDLVTGDFAQANSQAHAEWMERLYQGMESFQFGDTPREFGTPKGMLHLCKVDDGLYSGTFTKHEDGLEDNARVRIERQTIPELVQFMIAKEWIENHVVTEAKSPEPDYAPLQTALEVPGPAPQVLPPPPAMPVADPMAVRLLELVSRLIS